MKAMGKGNMAYTGKPTQYNVTVTDKAGGSVMDTARPMTKNSPYSKIANPVPNEDTKEGKDD